MKKNWKHIAKVIAFILEIFFFIPMCAVSCSGKEIKVSAWKATKAIKVEGEKVYDGDLKAVLLFVVPLVLLIVLFLIKNEMINRIVTVAAGCIDVGLLIDFNSKAHQFEDAYCTVRTLLPFYINFICNVALIGIGVYSFVIAYKSSGGQKEQLITRIFDDSVTDKRQETIPNSTSHTCPYCGSSISGDKKFCTNCGANLEQKLDLEGEAIEKICPNCGALTKGKFCSQCGTNIEENETAE